MFAMCKIIAALFLFLGLWAVYIWINGGATLSEGASMIGISLVLAAVAYGLGWYTREKPETVVPIADGPPIEPWITPDLPIFNTPAWYWLAVTRPAVHDDDRQIRNHHFGPPDQPGKFEHVKMPREIRKFLSQPIPYDKNGQELCRRWLDLSALKARYDRNIAIRDQVGDVDWSPYEPDGSPVVMEVRGEKYVIPVNRVAEFQAAWVRYHKERWMEYMWVHGKPQDKRHFHFTRSLPRPDSLMQGSAPINGWTDAFGCKAVNRIVFIYPVSPQNFLEAVRITQKSSNPFAPPSTEKGGSQFYWPPEWGNRDAASAWLMELAGHMVPVIEKKTGLDIPRISLACSADAFKAHPTWVGLCRGGPAGAEIFIRPGTHESNVDVAGTLAHELLHAALHGRGEHGPIFKSGAKLLGLGGNPSSTQVTPAFRDWVGPLVRAAGPCPARLIGAL